MARSEAIFIDMLGDERASAAMQAGAVLDSRSSHTLAGGSPINSSVARAVPQHPPEVRPLQTIALDPARSDGAKERRSDADTGRTTNLHPSVQHGLCLSVQ